MSVAFRIYGPDELRSDGYPHAWRKGTPSVKDHVRELANHRCVRCHHPYTVGAHGSGEWSPCDHGCAHRGPLSVAGIGPVEDSSPTLWLRDGLEVYAQWRILTVHHLNGVKYDCRWWNLAALCQRCHLSIQGRVRMEQLYPHEHSEWFKPYAAGYYASVYLGEELTEEQTMARLDELLALERAG